MQTLSRRRGGAFYGTARGCFGKTGPGSLASQSPAFPSSSGGWSVAGNLDPSLLPSMIPAEWFPLWAPCGLSGSALRPPESPRVEGRWYRPKAPLGQRLAPPSPGARAEGADRDGPGAWRLGAVPGAACAPGPTPSCGGAGFPLRQVRERLKGLGPRGPVRTAPPARDLSTGSPRSVALLPGRVRSGDLTLPEAHLTLSYRCSSPTPASTRSPSSFPPRRRDPSASRRPGLLLTPVRRKASNALEGGPEA